MKPKPSENHGRLTPDKPRVDPDAPLQLEPDDDEDERHGYGWSWSQRVTQKLHEQQARDAGHLANGQTAPDSQDTVIDVNDVSVVDRSVVGAEGGHMSDVLRWALDSIHEPAIAAADWLARDIDPQQPSASALLTDPKISLAQVKQAKSVFKTMRIVGEKSADRRVGARMYAAAIAAGLVRHQRLVSRQSTEALKRGFQGLLDDVRMPQPLRDLAGMALCALAEKRFKVDAKDEPPRRAPPTPRPQARANGPASKSGNARKR